MDSVDVVVIGSGAGGLTAAVALARTGRRVLVVEQHDVPGGWCHSFRLGGHQFSPGVHYIGELGDGGRMRRVYEGLGVSGDLTFLELNPEGYEHLIVGDQRFDVPRGRDRWIDRLKARFPHEARGIDGYFRDVTALVSELQGAFRDRGPLAVLTLPFRAPTLTFWGLRPIDRLLDRHVRDPLLRAFLTIQAGDHGLGPAEAPAAVHASVQAHYFDGAWYPRGGGAAIPRAFVNALKRNGGSIRLETRVERILTEPAPDGGRRAVGVKLADGTEVRARAVISNADPGVTYGRLFPPAEVPGEVRRALDKARWSVSCLSLYLAVDADLRSWGLDSGNLWYSRTPDVQAGYAIAQRAELDGDDFPGQFLTVTTLKDPSKGVGTTHTLESFVFVSWDAFRTWAHTKFGERPADYAAMKDALADRMLRNIDRFVPGLSRHVTFRELGTPLTNAHYCMSTRGNLYGTAKDAWQVGPFAWRVRSPIGGLFLCGASTISHGVMGATMSGLYAAAAVARCSSDELLRSQGPELRTLPCDDLSAWPEDLRKRIALKRAARGAEAVAADA